MKLIIGNSRYYRLILKLNTQNMKFYIFKKYIFRSFITLNVKTPLILRYKYYEII